MNRPPQPTEEERRAAEIDLERIREGGIPLGAEERLKRVAGASSPFFTSDLSSKEYALAQASGLQPVAQVMGSSVVQHGLLQSQVGAVWGSAEVKALSDPWNIARSRAFARLRQEAELAGADAVIGIDMSISGSLDLANTIEYVVFGTAVRDHAFPRHGNEKLGLCALSGQEVDKLRRIGAKPVGIVGHTTVISVGLDFASSQLMNSGRWFGGRNAEIPEIAEGVSNARHRAMSEVRRQANVVRADNIVISTLDHSIHHYEYEVPGGANHYFYVTMHILGTAIQLGTRQPHPAPFTAPVMSISIGA